VNFAECPDDGSRLKVDPGQRVGARPLIMRCPTCSKRFTFSDDGIIEIRYEEDSPPD
jgi:hypothetical protein